MGSIDEANVEVLNRRNIPFEPRWLFEKEHHGWWLSPLRGLVVCWHESPWADAHGYMLSRRPPLRLEGPPPSRERGDRI